MRKISYKDPYESKPEVLEVRDEDSGNLEEVMECLEEETRKADNLERKERYHRKYRLDYMKLKEKRYASNVDIEAEFLREEEERIIDEWLRKNLTLNQYRRFRYYMEGLTLREIAELEGVDYKSVQESVTAARKKLQKLCRTTPSDTPF